MDGFNKFLVSLSRGPCFLPHDINSNHTIPIDSSEESILSNVVQNQTVPWALIEDKHLLNILSYVNYSDLLQCRLISRYFRHVISKSQLFIGSTVFINSAKPDNLTEPSILKNTVIPFETARFEHIDHDVYIGLRSEDRALENPAYSPRSSFLSNLKSIQFQNCFIRWETIKRVITATPKLEQLSIIACNFAVKPSPSPLGEFEEFSVGRTFTHLKYLKFIEHRNLKSVNKLLEKLVGYRSHNLEDFIVAFDPSGEEGVNVTADKADMESFCNLTRSIVEANISKLQRFSMDLKYPALLNMFIPSVFGKMDSLWAELNLIEFSLSPAGCTPTPKSTEITKNTISSAQILIGFLESQTQLKKAAIPHFRTIGGEQHYKGKIGRSLAHGIEYLCVPNQDYLPHDFLSRYSSLKKLYVGGSVGEDLRPLALHSEMFDQICNPVTLHATGTAGLPANLDLNLALSGSTYTFPPSTSNNRNEAWDKLQELGIGSTIINGVELKKTIRKFNFLTKLEVTSQLPVMQDEDVQALIEGVPGLQFLNVAACNYLSDYGITGILRNTCEMMVRLQNYSEIQDSVALNSRVNHGKPLSQLKGLRHLILMGKSHITDVGVHFGLRFTELQSACLPYNKNITEWGITKFGDNNPSLQIFLMSTVNQRSKDGFLRLQNNHPRVCKNKCAYFKEIVDDTLPALFSNDVTEPDEVPFGPPPMDAVFLCSAFTFPSINWFSKSEKAETAGQLKDVTETGNDDDYRFPIPTITIPTTTILPSNIPSEKENANVVQKESVKVVMKEEIQVKKAKKVYLPQPVKISKLPKPQGHTPSGKSEFKSDDKSEKKPELKKRSVWKLHPDIGHPAYIAEHYNNNA